MHFLFFIFFILLLNFGQFIVGCGGVKIKYLSHKDQKHKKISKIQEKIQNIKTANVKS